MSSACAPFTDVAGESFKEVNCCASFNSGEKRVHVTVEGLAEVGPVSPISQADFLSLIHDAIEGVSSRKSIKTLEIMLVCSRSSSHELPCWRGKSELNLVRKAASSREQLPLAFVD